MTIPIFESAILEFQELLTARGHSTNLCWVFRDDLLLYGANRILFRNPSNDENLILVMKVFNEARTRGLVEIVALAGNESITTCTVWFPRTAKDELQGWNQGMKLSISIPFLLASPCNSAVMWWSLKFFHAIVKRHNPLPFVESHAWAAA